MINFASQSALKIEIFPDIFWYYYIEYIEF